METRYTNTEVWPSYAYSPPCYQGGVAAMDKLNSCSCFRWLHEQYMNLTKVFGRPYGFDYGYRGTSVITDWRQHEKNHNRMFAFRQTMQAGSLIYIKKCSSVVFFLTFPSLRLINHFARDSGHANYKRSGNLFFGDCKSSQIISNYLMVDNYMSSTQVLSVVGYRRHPVYHFSKSRKIYTLYPFHSLTK